jgi:hypothetical protein
MLWRISCGTVPEIHIKRAAMKTVWCCVTGRGANYPGETNGIIYSSKQNNIKVKVAKGFTTARSHRFQKSKY